MSYLFTADALARPAGIPDWQDSITTMETKNTMRILSTLGRWLAFCAMAATTALASPLRMYFVDAEGGQATLIVEPSGKSMLIDTGWPGFEGRDANRIVAAAKQAGLSHLDYVLITHYHVDHVGGVPQLAEKIKIATFIDHGPNREDSDETRRDFAAYEKVLGGAQRLIAKPGDHIPFGKVDVEVVSADGVLLPKPLHGAGQPNPLCTTEPEYPEDVTENARSVGVMLTFGKLRVLDLGDLTKKKELGLACPNNLLGTVDLFVVTHHGYTQSNTRALVHAIHPRVAIMDNGARKAGSPDAWQAVHDSPGLADLWQLHYSIEGGKDHNVATEMIANPEENCAGKSIEVTAERDGTIKVTNTRNGFTKAYKK